MVSNVLNRTEPRDGLQSILKEVKTVEVLRRAPVLLFIFKGDIRKNVCVPSYQDLHENIDISFIPVLSEMYGPGHVSTSLVLEDWKQQENSGQALSNRCWNSL